ncbi:uncharacterized protein LOC125033002 [Penaeus chinensis]|uniref:uncharacterized protein LOC125033002 n=1 Tax=Penaeus chinensis TaxID=139456 RepID=UPI001FB85B79|nr:uncharacterized protein LOC125033002 [Penaeus chinensis]
MPKSTAPKWNLGKPLALIFAVAVIVALFSLRGYSQENKNKRPGSRGRNEAVLRKPKAETRRPTDGQALITYIRQHLIRPPATAAYNLTYPEKSHFTQYSRQTQNAYGIFNAKSKGVFVEARARDGEERSHTLYFEKHLSWTGILIEPDPSLFETLMSKNRRAFAVHATLATSDSSVTSSLSRLTSNSLPGPPVTSVPLFSVLQALNTTRIDFLSLDVEGAELQVLQTIPWDRVKVRLMCVKANRVPGGPTFLTQYMEEQGYASLGLTENDIWFAFL